MMDVLQLVMSVMLRNESLILRLTFFVEISNTIVSTVYEITTENRIYITPREFSLTLFDGEKLRFVPLITPLGLPLAYLDGNCVPIFSIQFNLCGYREEDFHEDIINGIIIFSDGI